MSLLYAEEHLACFLYSKEDSLIEIMNKEKGEIWEFLPLQNCIFFLLRGEIALTSGTLTNKKIRSGRFLILPGHKKSIINIAETATVMVMKLNINLAFCDHFPLERIYDEKLKDKDGLHLLKINPIAKSYIALLENYFADGLRCTYFIDLKVKEFMYVLRAYYPKKDLQLFFQPILNKDLDFSMLAFKHVRDVKTVKELAAVMNYSLSGFEKRFKKVFGMPASKWMEQNKAQEIYHEINCSKKTITEIGYDFGYSPSHFNDYCKRIFKMTPSKLRERQESYLTSE